MTLCACGLSCIYSDTKFSKDLGAQSIRPHKTQCSSQIDPTTLKLQVFFMVVCKEPNHRIDVKKAVLKKIR
jgi:hypothetical protein